MLSNDTSFALIGKRLEPVAANHLLRLSDVYDYTAYYTIIRYIPYIGKAKSYNLPPLMICQPVWAVSLVEQRQGHHRYHSTSQVHERLYIKFQTLQHIFGYTVSQKRHVDAYSIVGNIMHAYEEVPSRALQDTGHAQSSGPCGP
jgi:hypothetical protein